VLVALTIAGAGDDPAAPLAALDAANGTELAKRAERLEVDGRPAVHVVAAAQSDAGPVTADLTWIAHAGRILRITGVAQQPDFDAYATTFRAVARSVRTPSATERSAVREARVRLVRAPRGDTVERLAARPGSTWDAAMVRIANGMADGAQPAAGEVVKVAVSEPYRGRR
jgi:predicted Zn-dependent protease